MKRRPLWCYNPVTVRICTVAKPMNRLDTRPGVLCALAAYIVWGSMPAFWKLLGSVPASETLVHRMVWSLVFLSVLLAMQVRWRWIARHLSRPRTLLASLAGAALLSINWYVFIWAMNHGFVLQSSLGYFICPLVSVMLAAAVLRERLRWWQGVAVAIALLAVGFLSISLREVPTIALILATTFALYGLLRKISALESLEGLWTETVFMFVPALVALMLIHSRGSGSFVTQGVWISSLLVSTGVVTSLPLLLFAHGARRASLTTIGILQYITPSAHFLLGKFVYRETFTTYHWIAFAAVWVAVSIYVIEGMLRSRANLGHAVTPFSDQTQSHDPAAQSVSNV
ncbi:MAG TPA: EamA family transporter RarD [candidate division Zixibacteria bacterium]